MADKPTYKEFEKKVKRLERQVAKYKEFQEEIKRSEENKERRLAEEERKKDYLNLVGVMVVAIDADKKVSFINDAGCNILGYKKEEIIDKNWFDNFLPERFRKEVNKVFKNLMAGEVILDKRYENPILRKDGEERIIRWNNELLRDDKGNIIGTISAAEDITDQRAVEEKFKDLYENARDMIITVTTDGIITSLNPAFETITGFKRSDWIDKPFGPLIHPDDIKSIRKYDERVMRGEAPSLNEARGLTKSGKYKVIEMQMTPQFKDGKVVGLLGVGRDVTERKKAKEDKEDIDKKIAAITDSAHDAVIMRDDEGNITFWNKAAEKMYGYTRQEAVGENLPKLLLPKKTQKLYAEVIGRLIRKGENAPHGETLESVDIRKDGTEFPVEVSVSVIKLRGKWNSIAIVRDITERRQSEEDIRLHELRLRSLLKLNKKIESSENEIISFVTEEIVKFTQSKHVFVGFINEDETVLSLQLFSREAMKECATLERPVDFPIKKAGIWAEAVRQRKPIIVNDYSAPSPAKRGYPKGHVPIKRFLCVPVFDGERIVALACVANKEKDYQESDINALTSMSNDMWRLIQFKRSEEEVLRLTEFYQKILDGIITGVWVTDKKDVISFANKGMGVIAGIKAGDIEGASILKDFPESTMKFFRPYYLKAKKTKKIIRYDAVTVVTPDGRQSYQSGWLIPLVKNNKFDGMICTVEDITDRKKAEEEKEEIWRQLLQSQKLESIGRLTGVMAHDFKNIISTVISYSNLILKELGGGSPVDKNLMRIKHIGEKAVVLIDKLLVFSRQQELELKKCNLNSIIKECAEMLDSMVSGKVKLELNTKKPVKNVMADITQIEHVITNLEVNEKDAMPTGGTLIIETKDVELTKENAVCYHDEKPGSFVMITVKDNGVGMTREVKDRIFDPFFTTKKKAGGSGLGLSAVFGIIKQHGGCIRVESEHGKGSVFEIFLPVVKA
jgi:PAS domain S-box-containing protein